MEFTEVLRKRKMVRTFDPDPLDPGAVERILAAGARAPSAGYAQGFAFLAFDGPEETARFWDAASSGPEWPNPGLRAAPLVVVPLAGKDVYLTRYAEDDKGWTDRDEGRWPVPYWLVDTSFASMLVLLAAVDEGLGALFFGLDADGYARLRAAVGIPDPWTPIGALAIGRPAAADPVRSSAHTRPRRELAELVHRGGW
jgi:nitroreductase